MPGSAIIAAIGAFWFFERTLLTKFKIKDINDLKEVEYLPI